MLKAKRLRAAIAVEELSMLRHILSQKSTGLVDKLSRFAYRKLLQVLEAKCLEYNVPIIHVDPRNTSKKCPRCGSTLHYTHRLATCPRCGLKTDRNTVGAMNIWLKTLQTIAPRPRVAGAPTR